jgi:hypothetical protein
MKPLAMALLFLLSCSLAVPGDVTAKSGHHGAKHHKTKSVPVTRHGRQTATIVRNKQGGLIVKDKGGKGKHGVIGSYKNPK